VSLRNPMLVTGIPAGQRLSERDGGFDVDSTA
jgi:hypothetical protein